MPTNGSIFISEVERICRTPVRVLTGRDEARLAAYGIVSGIWRPEGVVGDLGGGSLELVEIKHDEIGRGQTLPLGGIRLQEASEGKIARAQKIVEQALSEVEWLPIGAGKDLLCGRRDLAFAGPPASSPERLSAACDA